MLAESGSAFAQIQVRDTLSGYLSFGAALQSTDQFFDQSGESIESSEFDITTLDLYAELGLIDRYLMLTFSGQLFRRNESIAAEVEEPFGGIVRGVGDFRIGLWTTLLQSDALPGGPFRLLAATQFGIPAGDPSPSAPGDLNFLAENLPTGDGEFDVEFNLSAAKVLEFSGYPLRHFVDGRVGYWLRTEGFADNVTYWFQVGTQPKFPVLDRFWLMFGINGTQSFIDLGDPAAFSSSTIGIGNGVSYTYLSAELQVRLPLGFGLGGRIDDAIEGNLILDAVTFRVYGSLEFDAL